MLTLLTLFAAIFVSTLILLLLGLSHRGGFIQPYGSNKTQKGSIISHNENLGSVMSNF